jgi:hypothetical protein
MEEFSVWRLKGEAMSKYGNRKTEINGMVFDSKHEAERWIELKHMERAGLIDDLQRQVKFELIPNIYEGKKVVQRSASYIADFVYMRCGERIVEDAKSAGTITDVYKLKKKLMRWKYGIDIQEV